MALKGEAKTHAITISTQRPSHPLPQTEQRRSGETDIWFYCAKDITDGGSCQHLQGSGAPSAEAAPTPHTQILDDSHDPQRCPLPQDSRKTGGGGGGSQRNAARSESHYPKPMYYLPHHPPPVPHPQVTLEPVHTHRVGDRRLQP